MISWLNWIRYHATRNYYGDQGLFVRTDVFRHLGGFADVRLLMLHSNWRLPVAVERRLVTVIVTPRMHGIHHSIVERETNANWSSILTWWDRLHGTLRLDVPQEAIVIGLPAYRTADELTVGRLVAMPFGRQRESWRLIDGTHPDRPPVAAPTRLAA